MLVELAESIEKAADANGVEEQAIELTAASTRSIELGQTLSAWLSSRLQTASTGLKRFTESGRERNSAALHRSRPRSAGGAF